MAETREHHLIARTMGLTITVGAARRMFLGVSRSALYAIAPHDGRVRHLSFGQAFDVARRQFEGMAAEATAQRAADDREAALEEARAAAALPALDHLANVIGFEMAGLSASLVARGVSDRARCITEDVAGLSARHAARARVRVARQIKKAGLADGSTS